MIGANTNIVGKKRGIESLFATPTTARLLAVFSLYPERTFIQRELVEQVGGSLYLVQRDLERLEAVGLVRRHKRGRQVEYVAESNHPAFPGLRDAMLNTVALGDRLKAALASVQGVSLAFVFGSVASGEASATSDLDILVVGDLGIGPRKVAPALSAALRDIEREPNLIVMDVDEFGRRRAQADHFLTSVLSGPRIWLVGDDEQLERSSE